jgi:hypothetical protein
MDWFQDHSGQGDKKKENACTYREWNLIIIIM